MKSLYARALLAVFAGIASQSTFAKDLGIHGNVWPITEVDIRQMMLEDAAKADWGKVQEEIKDNAKTYLERLPKRQMPSIDVTTTEWFDPSIELEADIQAPVQLPDGSYAWQVLAKKGTRVNPLHQVRPTQALFFYDGGNEEQLKFVKALALKEPEKIMFIEAGTGSVKQASEDMSMPVYHANDAMLQRFQVRYLPTMVYPGTGPNTNVLGVTAFAFPYSLSEVLTTWADFGFKLQTPPTQNSTKGGR